MSAGLVGSEYIIKVSKPILLSVWCPGEWPHLYRQKDKVLSFVGFLSCNWFLHYGAYASDDRHRLDGLLLLLFWLLLLLVLPS